MARYPEACAALARHAALVSAGDRRAAGRLLERKAAELARGGEIAGGIALYRLLIREHRDTRSAPRAHLAIAALLADHRTDVAGAIREYNRLLHDFPDSKEAELVPYELARWHITKEEVHRYGRAN
jgi:tetratricopeptide (TPR) repeat protein